MFILFVCFFGRFFFFGKKGFWSTRCWPATRRSSTTTRSASTRRSWPARSNGRATSTPSPKISSRNCSSRTAPNDSATWRWPSSSQSNRCRICSRPFSLMAARNQVISVITQVWPIVMKWVGGHCENSQGNATPNWMKFENVFFYFFFFAE